MFNLCMQLGKPLGNPLMWENMKKCPTLTWFFLRSKSCVTVMHFIIHAISFVCATYQGEF